MKRNRKRYALAALLAFVVATASFAFAAQNTVANAGRAGTGDNDVSGYTVSNVSWDLDNTNPSNVDAVEFDLDESASEVFVRIDTVAGATDSWSSWTGVGDCTNAGNTWTCDLSGVSGITTLNTNGLEVAAAS